MNNQNSHVEPIHLHHKYKTYKGYQVQWPTYELALDDCQVVQFPHAHYSESEHVSPEFQQIILFKE